MKPLITFVLGAVAASGIVYLAMRRPEPAPVQQAAASQPAIPVTVPSPQVVETPVPPPEAPAAVAPSPTPPQKHSAWKSQKPARPRPSVEARNRVPETRPAPPAAQPNPVPQQQSQPVPSKPAPVAEPDPAPRSEPAPPPAPEPRSVTLQGGMVLNVRIGETLSSDRNKAGDRFSATLDQPLVVDGLVIAERGARVEGRVVDTEKAGRVKGVSDLALELVSLRTSDHQNIRIQTEEFDKHGEHENGKDAAKVGAASALGAVIGAIAGGGKGAAIGAGAGAGAGTGGVLMTRGKPSVIPVETRISFRLRGPVTITEKLQ